MWCIITSIWVGLLIAFLLGLLLGWWLWYGFKRSFLDIEEEKDMWERKYNELSSSKKSVKKKVTAKATSVALPKGVKLNDLTVVEGIGPKISQILKDGGVRTWQELADSPVEFIQKLLNEAGNRYKLANPGSWPKQAKMAANGEWEKLQAWQDKHDRGIES